jgi:hypothetical protein
MAITFPTGVANGYIYTDSTSGSRFQYFSNPGVWKYVAYSATPTLAKASLTGDGVTTSFGIPGGYVANQVSVYLNGSYQRPGVDVNIGSGVNIVFTTPPPVGSLVDAVGTGTFSFNGASVLVNQQFTANGSANSFAITGGYLPGTLSVYLNGVKQIPVTDVDTTSGANVGFISTPPNNYIIDVFGYQSAITVTTNSIVVGNTTVIGSAITVGNSSVNAYMTPNTISISNSSTNTTITTNSIVLGNTTIASNTFSISNSTVNTTIGINSISVGNSSVNTTITVNTVTSNTAIHNFYNANGSLGTAGQALVSGGPSGNAYWGAGGSSNAKIHAISMFIGG